MSSPKSLCILRLSALGDVCNAVAAVQAIQAQFPDCKITWVIGKIEYQLVQHLPDIDFIIFDKKGGSASIKAFKQAVANIEFDILLHMQVAMRANYLAWLIRAKRKIGYDWGRAKEGHSLVVNQRIAPLSGRKKWHVLDSFMDFAKAAGVEEHYCYPPRWNIPVPDADTTFANETLGSKPSLIICPAASKQERCWLTKRYAEVAQYANRRGLQVVLCGGPAELDLSLAQAISEQCKVPLINLVGKTSLTQMYALLGKAMLVLAPDTGPAHMANAHGTTVIGLYAHSDPNRTGPYGSLPYVASAYAHHVKAQHKRTPENTKWGQRVKGEHLMADISTKEVIALLDQALLDKANLDQSLLDPTQPDQTMLDTEQ
jgi:heptosyltransferase I